MPDLEEGLRGILIDPYNKTVTEVITKQYPVWKSLIECDMIEAVTIMLHPDGSRETLWVDEEFLLNDKKDGPWFQISAHPQPMGGKGIILHTTAEGDSKSTLLPLDLIQGHVTWPDVEFTGFTFHEGVSDESHLFGPGITVHEQRSHFKPREPNSNSDPDEVD